MTIEQQIFTSCPKGQGYEGISGFQIKARSTGLSEEASQAILPFSNHYRLPRDLRLQENEYYGRGENLPAAFLDRLPVAITYHRITKELFGLTRTHYLGRDHTNRPGNFWAHTLVFAPEALKPCAYNPVSLTRSRLYNLRPGTDQTTLDSVDQIDRYLDDTCKPPHDWMKRVTAGSYRASYQSLLGALAADRKPQVPIILCFEDITAGVDYIEALLMLLPQELRCRTTFTTYEPDPYSGTRKAENSLQVVVTIPPRTGGTFEFRPSEMNQFWVRDFTENRTSSFPDTSPYAQTVLGMVDNGQAAELNNLHDRLIRLGAGCRPETWNALSMTEQLSGDLNHLSEQNTAAALAMIEQVAQQEDQIEYALELGWPLLEQASLRDNSSLGSPACAAAGKLFNALAAAAPFRLTYQSRLLDLCTRLLFEGLVTSAARLTTALRLPLLSEAMTRLESQGWPCQDLRTNPSTFQRDLNTLLALTNITETQPRAIALFWTCVSAALTTHPTHPIAADSLQQLIKLRSTPGRIMPSTLPEQAEALASQMLRQGRIVYTKQLLTLSGRPLVALTEHLYDELVNAGWPAEWAHLTDVDAAQQTTLIDLLSLVLTDKIDLNRALPAFRAAQWVNCPQKLWERTRKPLLSQIERKVGFAQTSEFINPLKEILRPYPECIGDLFTITMLQTKHHKPDGIEMWTKREIELSNWAYANLENNKNGLDQTLALLDDLPSAQRVEILEKVFVAPDSDPDLSRLMHKSIITRLNEIAQQQLKEALNAGAPPNWVALRQTLQTAHKMGAADVIWRQMRANGLENSVVAAHDPQTRDWLAELIQQLSEYTNCAGDVVQLRLIQLHTPESSASSNDLLAIAREGINLALRASNPPVQIRDLFVEIRKTTSPLDVVRLMNTLYSEFSSQEVVTNALNRSYRELMTQIDPDQAWTLRQTLAADPKDLLISELVYTVITSQDQAELDKWYSRILEPYQRTFYLLVDQLTNQVSDIPVETRFKILAHLGRQRREIFRPFAIEVMAYAPFNLLMAQDLSWFDLNDLRDIRASQARKRIILIQQYYSLRKSNGERTESDIFSEIRRWDENRVDLDPQAYEWAINALPPFFTQVDLAESVRIAEYRTICYQAFTNGAEAASSELYARLQNDPVKLLVYLVGLGQYSIRHIDDTETKNLAQIIGVTAEHYLTARQRDFMWQTLEKYAHKISGKYQSFLRLTEPEQPGGIFKKIRLFSRRDKSSGNAER